MTASETEPNGVALERSIQEPSSTPTAAEAPLKVEAFLDAATADEVPLSDAAKPSSIDTVAEGTLLTAPRPRYAQKSATAPSLKGPSKARAAQYTEEHVAASKCRRKHALAHGKGVAGRESHWANYTEAWEYVGGLDVDDGNRQIKIFDEVRVAEDGGFSEIGERAELWSNTRPLFGLIALIFAVVNPLMLIQGNLHVLMGEPVVLPDGPVVSKDSYLLTTHFLRFVSGGSVDITGYSVQVVLVAELVMLSVLFVQVFYYMGCMACLRHFKRWHSGARLFFDFLGTAGSFSGMKILFYIAPQVLSNQICYVLFYQDEKKLLTLVWLIVSRAVFLVIGMDTFLVKYRMVQNDINQPEFDFHHFLRALLFLNQVLKAVDLNWVVRQRLFRYVFGGEDGVMTHREVIRMDTWNARVVQKVFQSYPLWQAISLLSTWSDDDFQLLTLNEAKAGGTPASATFEVAALDEQIPV